MDELPELPFERILSFLSLEDVIKSRGVSRNWCIKTDNFRAKSLCFSKHPRDFIDSKRRWVSDGFAQNFISSTRFVSFFNTFGRTILSNLKHLRLCDLSLDEENRHAFVQTLNSFGQLEELDIIEAGFKQQVMLKLSLPMLNSIQLHFVHAIRKLTLDAPRLKRVKVWRCPRYLRLDIVHTEPVERLLTDRLEYTQVTDLKNFKNLQYLYNEHQHYYRDRKAIDSTLLFSLEQLKEIHLYDNCSIKHLFEQKQQLCRTELKIYLRGLLLSGPNDPAIRPLLPLLGVKRLRCLAGHRSRLADEIPLEIAINYSAIERVDPGLEVDLLKPFTDLCGIIFEKPVQDVQRFLNVLKNFPNIVIFVFRCDQPQDLFDRLPEHSAVQKLSIMNIRAPLDFRFLFRLKNLGLLELWGSVNVEIIRKVFGELRYLYLFSFLYNDKDAAIKADHSKRFEVSLDCRRKWTSVADLNGAIQFLAEKCVTEETKVVNLE